MRPEELEKATPVVYVYGADVYSMGAFNCDSEINIQLELKTQEHLAIENIRQLQADDRIATDGYYLSRGLVYKVYRSNDQVKKIVGREAKSVKRLIKSKLG